MAKVKKTFSSIADIESSFGASDYLEIKPDGGGKKRTIIFFVKTGVFAEQIDPSTFKVYQVAGINLNSIPDPPLDYDEKLQ